LLLDAEIKTVNMRSTTMLSLIMESTISSYTALKIQRAMMVLEEKKAVNSCCQETHPELTCLKTRRIWLRVVKTYPSQPKVNSLQRNNSRMKERHSRLSWEQDFANLVRNRMRSYLITKQVMTSTCNRSTMAEWKFCRTSVIQKSTFTSAWKTMKQTTAVQATIC
jgi:hypothetical protein